MEAGIALGSNIEPRLGYLREAAKRVAALHQGEGPVLASRIYETEPVGCPAGAESFLNAFIEIDSTLDAYALLHTLQAIEADLGRARSGKQNESRTVDLDLIYLGNLRITTSELTLPHPRAVERPFVVRPLADVRSVSPLKSSVDRRPLGTVEHHPERIEITDYRLLSPY